MSVKKLLKEWKNDPQLVADFEYNKRILQKEQDLLEKLQYMNTSELRELYFSNEISISTQAAIVSLGNAPYEAIIHALYNEEPFPAEAACGHYKLTDSDLEKASKEHPRKSIRTEAARVLSARREKGYEGPEDLTTNRNLVG